MSQSSQREASQDPLRATQPPAQPPARRTALRHCARSLPALVLAMLVGACTQAGDMFLFIDPPAPPLAQIDKALDQGRYDRAIRLSNQALRANSGATSEASSDSTSPSAGVLIRLAEAEALSGDFEAAEATAMKADSFAVAAGPLTERNSQRALHYGLGRAYEAASKDKDAEGHYRAALELCQAHETLDDRAGCNAERQALIRLYVATERFRDAEPYVLKSIAATQSWTGPYDVRLAYALGDASKFYSRQGRYQMASPLFTRGYRIWSDMRGEAYDQHYSARSNGEPSPFDDDFTLAKPGHYPFTAPNGLDEQVRLLPKLNAPERAAEAAQLEAELWSDDKIGENFAQQRLLDATKDPNSPALEQALALTAIAYVHLKKARLEEAEADYRGAFEQFGAAWPQLNALERRTHATAYLSSLAALAHIARVAGQRDVAVRLNSRCVELASAEFAPSDSRHLDALIDLAIAQREAERLEDAEATLTRYLDLAREFRGSNHEDYAWGLRQLAYVNYAKDDMDASRSLHAQADKIWADLDPVLPEF